jgi:hypothetical protein
MSREIIDIKRAWVPIWDDRPVWKVTYTAKANGRTYFEHVQAKDELEAYTIVMGLRKQPQPTKKAPTTC